MKESFEVLLDPFDMFPTACEIFLMYPPWSNPKSQGLDEPSVYSVTQM
jgi:hypothetical protein